jgi:hypothetical protein
VFGRSDLCTIYFGSGINQSSPAARRQIDNRSGPYGEAGEEFYTALFGWEHFVGPPESGNYTQALVGGKSVVGLMRQQGWTTYLNADSADTVAASISARRPRSLRTRSTITRLSERSFSLARSSSAGVAPRERKKEHRISLRAVVEYHAKD